MMWLMIGWVSAVMADETERIEFHISPGPAERSLLQFSYQSNLNIFFAPQDVRGTQTNGVDGFMEPRGALSRLLDGTSLCPTYTQAGKSITVKRCSNTEDDAIAAAPGGGGPVQEAPIAPPPMQTIPVTATATHIHGVAPIIVGLMTISREDFEALGIRTTADLLAKIPMLSGMSLLGPRAEKNSGLGAAVGLRGQGAAATQILVNDHRLPGGGALGAFQDIANIPLSAIERVDIVPDGASAQYGSDAVGGVVNIRTLSGPQQSVTSGQFNQGLGGFQQAIFSQIAGKDWEGGSVVATVEYIHATTWRGPNLVAPRTSDIVDRVPGKELASGYLHLEQAVPFRTDLAAEGIYTHRREAEQYDTALPTVQNAAVPEKTGVAVQMTYLAAESRTLFGSDGVLVASFSRATETERQRIYPSGAVEFADGALEDPSNVGVDATWFSTFSRNEQFNVRYDDTLWSYDAGKIKGVLAGEYRRETFNPLDNTTSFATRTRYGRHVRAVFGELSIPIVGEATSLPGVRKLELSIAGRREWYSDFKGRYTPQYHILWAPRSGVEVLGSLGRSSQAPNLLSLDTSKNAIVVTPLADGQSSTGESNALVEAGNNSHLTGETATTLSVGIKFDWPISDKSFANAELNFFRIHFYERIQGADLTQFALDALSYAPLVNRDFTDAEHQELCANKLFVGDPVTCGTGQIAAIVDATLKNIDSLSTKGLDIRGNWGADFGAVRAGINLQAVYFYQFDERITPAAPAVHLLRTEKSPIEFQLSSLFSITYGAADFGLLVHCLSGFRDESTTPVREVPGWTTVDLRVSYTVPRHLDGLLRNVTFIISAQNIADRPLPVLRDPSINQSYDFLSGFAVRRLLSFAFQKRL